MKSIHSFLLSRLLGGAAVVLAIAGLTVYLVVTRSLAAQFDRNLADRVKGFASIIFQHEDDVVEFEFSDELMPEYELGLAMPDYFELWYQDGRLLERSNSLGRGDLTLPVEATFDPQYWTTLLPDGRPGRFVAQLIEVHHVFPEEGPNRPNAETVLVTVARGRESLVVAERVVLLKCGLVFAILLSLIGVLSWRAVSRGLEPAKRLATALDRIQVEELPERLDLGELPSELAPVAEKTDALIGRVDAALERERRTTADIAHELRTPISEMITVSEVALRNGRDAEETRKALGTVRDVAWRVGRSVSTLLKLARLEMGAETFDRKRVELGDVVGEALRPLAALGRERGVRVENSVADDDVVLGDPEVLRIVVSNLLSNALDYSPREGTVQCGLERSGGDWRFVVANEAPDLSPADLAVLSEPFWRKDTARADRNHSGLGLALSRALAQDAGMRLDFELEAGNFRAVLAGTEREPSPRAEDDLRSGQEPHLDRIRERNA